jgi:hypothetical protein
MQTDNNKNNDSDLDSFSNEDSNFENLFDEPEGSTSKSNNISVPKEKSSRIIPAAGKKIEDLTFEEERVTQKKKRSISDFEPDMDALLLTAQSSMIIEGMEFYNNKNFAAETVQVYNEALKGVDLYIKILNRNPNNYRKLKTLIDADTDCQQVEKIAFELYKEEYETPPDTDKEKLEAFELFKIIFRQSFNKASISRSMKILRKYFLLSGGLDTEKIEEGVKDDSLEIKKDINHFNQYLKLALDMLKKGDHEIAQGLRGRDLNVFITKASELLGYYYKAMDNTKISDYYYRIYNIYKKYFIMK